MRKSITVPVNDAFAADSECPVCAMFEQLENDAIEYTMGLAIWRMISVP